jgi:hypothetical protein
MSEKVDKLIHTLGLEFGLQDNVVKKIVQCPFKFTRETITNLELKEDLTEEEFNMIKTNFIYLHIGKLYISYTTYERIQKHKINLNTRWKKD